MTLIAAYPLKLYCWSILAFLGEEGETLGRLPGQTASHSQGWHTQTDDIIQNLIHLSITFTPACNYNFTIQLNLHVFRLIAWRKGTQLCKSKVPTHDPRVVNTRHLTAKRCLRWRRTTFHLYIGFLFPPLQIPNRSWHWRSEDFSSAKVILKQMKWTSLYWSVCNLRMQCSVCVVFYVIGSGLGQIVFGRKTISVYCTELDCSQ